MFKTSAVSHMLGAIALATILVGSTTGYLILQPAGNEPIGAGEGWLTGWSYRKSHAITAATGAGTNYQVKITVYYGGGTDGVGNVYLNSHCKTDFGDVRFTSSGGSALLNYWMQSSTSGDNAVFWVKVTDDLSTNSATIYVYYGNSGATTTSSIGNTFILGKDFRVDQNTDGWTVSNSPTISYSSTDGISMAKTSNYAQLRSNSALDFSTTKRVLAELKIDVAGSFGASNFICPTIAAGDAYYELNWVRIAHGSNINLRRRVAPNLGIIATTTAEPTNFHIHDLRIKVTSTGYLVWYVDDASQYSNTTESLYSTVSNYIYLSVYAGTGLTRTSTQKYIAVGKYVSPEPAHSTWGSEESLNSPPYAPTPSSPAVGYRFNPSTSVTFSWTFSDPDAGDYQTAYQFQLDDNNDFSSPITNPGKVLSWIYRKSHVINPATGAGVDYQVKLVVHYGSGTDSGADVYLNSRCRADFGDVRFTASEGTTQLSYWIESKTDSSQATFWVKISDDLSTTARTIYLYYGNSGVSTTSNGINTFLFFDDFADSNYADSWTTNGATWSEASGILSMAYANGLGAIYTKNYNVGHGIAVESKIKPDSGYRIALTTGRTDSSFHVEYVYDASTWGIAACNDAGTLWTSWVAGAGTTLVSGTWYTFKVLILPNNNVYLYCNDVLQLSYAQTSEYIGSIGFRHWYSGTTNFGDMRVRKYISSEPAHGNWGSEEQQSTCLQTLPSTVGLYYWRVKTWDSSNAEGPYCTGRTIFVDRVKITACGIFNNVVDTRTGGKVWYNATYESDSTPFTGSVGTLSLNSAFMNWTSGLWTYDFNYSMSGSQTTFHISGFTETAYSLTTLNNAAGDLVLNWATMAITINKP